MRFKLFALLLVSFLPVARAIPPAEMLFPQRSTNIGSGIPTSIASSGTNHLVALVESNGVVAVQLLNTNLALAASKLVLGTNGHSATLAYDSARYMAAWCESNAVVVEWITTAAQKYGIQIRYEGDTENADTLSLVANARGRALLLWRRTVNGIATIFARTVIADGSGIKATIYSVEAPAIYATASACDTNFVVAWTEKTTNGSWAVMSRAMNDDGVWLGPAVAVTQTNASEPFPVGMSSNGTNVLVAWSRETGPFPHYTSSEFFYAMIWGRLFDIYGTAIGDEFQIGRARGDQLWPSIAFDGKQFVVIWLDSRYNGSIRSPDTELYLDTWHLYARQVSPEGGLPERELRFGFRTGTTVVSNAPSMAWDGHRFVTVFGTTNHTAHAEFITRITPPRFSVRDISPGPGRSVSLTLEGDDLPGYQVQMSTNFVDWCPHHHLTPPGRLELSFYQFDGIFDAIDYTSAYYRARFPAYDCIRILREIQWAKQQRAVEHNRQSMDGVALTDLFLFPNGYLPEMPVCPSNGLFDLGFFGTMTRCAKETHNIFGGELFGGLQTD